MEMRSHVFALKHHEAVNGVKKKKSAMFRKKKRENSL